MNLNLVRYGMFNLCRILNKTTSFAHDMKINLTNKALLHNLMNKLSLTLKSFLHDRILPNTGIFNITTMKRKRHKLKKNKTKKTLRRMKTKKNYKDKK